MSKDVWNKLTLFLNFLWAKLDVPFSFQKYQKWEDEADHFSVRVECPDIPTLLRIRKYLTKHKFSWKEGSWDERQITKRAYELGTEIFFALQRLYQKSWDRREFVRLALHGLFNDLGYNYYDEESFYIDALWKLRNR